MKQSGFSPGIAKLRKAPVFGGPFCVLGSRIPVEILIIDLQVVLVIKWGRLVDGDTNAGSSRKMRFVGCKIGGCLETPYRRCRRKSLCCFLSKSTSYLLVSSVPSVLENEIDLIPSILPRPD